MPFPKITPAVLIAHALLLYPLHAAPKEDSDPPPIPSVGSVTGSPRVVRGGECEIVLRGIVMPRESAQFKIHKGPKHGTLEGPTLLGSDSAVYTYRHDGTKGHEADRVDFKIKTGSDNTWGPVTAEIEITEPASRVELKSNTLDFGSVPIGQSRSTFLQIRNGGGGVLRGSLETGEPWSIDGVAEFALAEGETRDFLVVFTPNVEGSQQGRLEIVTGREKQPVALRGTGIYRFAVQERFAFGGATGADTAEIPVINLMDRELTLSIGLSSPLTGEKSLLLPPKGAVGLKLGLEKRHYTEKFTEVTVSDGSAVRTVRVELPPPPALLEWASEDGEVDLGAIPKRQIPRPEFELRNRGATRATVEIRETEGGLALAKGQASRFDLLPGESTAVKTVWRLSENLGAVSSGLIASHGGLDHPLRVRGLVVEPPAAAQEPVVSTLPNEATPQPGRTPGRLLSETEQNDLNRRMPADIDYTPGTGGVNLTWKYAGPEPVLFWLEKKIVERTKAGLEDAFERRLQVPQDLPQPETTEKWVPIFPSEADIRKLEDGTWRGSVYGLEPGHHDVRIATRNPPNGSRIDYSEFAVRVFPPPPNPLWKWLAGAFGVLCLLYLLRKRLRRLFVRDPQQI